MTRTTIAVGSIAIVLILLALAAAFWIREQNTDRAAPTAPGG